MRPVSRTIMGAVLPQCARSRNTVLLSAQPRLNTALRAQLHKSVHRARPRNPVLRALVRGRHAGISTQETAKTAKTSKIKIFLEVFVVLAVFPVVH